jgi:hypothetical protein
VLLLKKLSGSKAKPVGEDVSGKQFCEIVEVKLSASPQLRDPTHLTSPSACQSMFIATPLPPLSNVFLIIFPLLKGIPLLYNISGEEHVEKCQGTASLRDFCGGMTCCSDQMEYGMTM